MNEILDNTMPGTARAEYIKVEHNVRLHITDAGKDKPVLRDADLRSDLKKIKISTVILHGRKDKICSFDPTEQMKSGISNSHIVAFENSGHSLFLEETKKFNVELIKFAGE